MWWNYNKNNKGGIPLDYSIKQEQTERHNLFIGVGGLGIEAIGKIKKGICLQIRENKFGKYDSLSFLAIDTDQHDLYKVCEEYCFNNTEILPISSTQLAMAWKTPEWFSYNKNFFGDITQGVGGIRQIGRVCLFYHIQKVYEKLLEKLRQNNVHSSGIDVHIIAGLSGGTGSGLFLDICYLLKHIMYQERITNCTVDGYCIMPDYLLNKFGYAINPAQRQMMLSNSYAALKEIHYYMNQNMTNHCFSEDYSPSIRVETTESPVDYLFLASSLVYPGQIMLPESTIDNIVDSIIDAFVCKNGNRHGRRIGWTLINSDFVIGYVSGSNYSKLVDLNTFHVSFMFSSMMKCVRKNHITKEDSNQFLLSIGIDVSAMRKELKNSIHPPIWTTGVPSDDDINEYIHKNVQIIDCNSTAFRNRMTERLEQKFQEIVCDVDLGISYIYELFSDNMCGVSKCIAQQLPQVDDMISQKKCDLYQVQYTIAEIKCKIGTANLFSRKRLLSDCKFLYEKLIEIILEDQILKNIQSLLYDLLESVNILGERIRSFEHFLTELEKECRGNLDYYERQGFDVDPIVDINYRCLYHNVMDVILSADSDATNLKEKIMKYLSSVIVPDLASQIQHFLIDYRHEYLFKEYGLLSEMKTCYHRDAENILHLERNWKDLMTDL